MKATLSSISILSNKKVIILYFLILPISNILLYVFLNNEFNAADNIYVIYSSVIITSVIHQITMFSSSFVYDINIGVVKIVFSSGRFPAYYFAMKYIVSLVTALIVGIIGLALVFLFTNNLLLLKQSLIILFVCLIYSAIISFVVTIASWGRANPYFWTNIMLAILYPLSGVIIFFSLYPPKIKELTYVIPFARTIGFLRDSSSNYWIDALIGLSYLVIAVAVYYYKIQSTKRNPKSSLL